MDARRHRDGLSHLLRDIRLWEAFERHNDLGARPMEDPCDLLGIQQRINRLHNSRD